MLRSGDRERNGHGVRGRTGIPFTGNLCSSGAVTAHRSMDRSMFCSTIFGMSDQTGGTERMLTHRHRGVRVVALAALAVLAAACGSSAPMPPPSPSTSAPPSAADAALAAYKAFWVVQDAALASPRSKDWTGDLHAVASGQALTTALADVANYASLPAHTRGAITRSPTVQSSTSERATILDCVDLGDSRVVSDTTGAVLNDLKNRVQRFRFHANVATDSAGKWLVDSTAPALSEPC